ncbi:MAG TPA: hypothetical protein VJ934_12915 [Desulfomicrobiaceae bacterium]|nr:hypothetical protein [Desulfomicrobiaceae bacterium]
MFDDVDVQHGVLRFRQSDVLKHDWQNLGEEGGGNNAVTIDGLFVTGGTVLADNNEEQSLKSNQNLNGSAERLLGEEEEAMAKKEEKELAFCLPASHGAPLSSAGQTFGAPIWLLPVSHALE